MRVRGCALFSFLSSSLLSFIFVLMRALWSTYTVRSVLSALIICKWSHLNKAKNKKRRKRRTAMNVNNQHI